MAEVIDLEVYKQLLKMRLYLEWRQNPSNHEFFDYDAFIVVPETAVIDEEALEFMRQFFGAESDTFIFTK